MKQVVFIFQILYFISANTNVNTVKRYDDSELVISYANDTFKEVKHIPIKINENKEGFLVEIRENKNIDMNNEKRPILNFPGNYVNTTITINYFASDNKNVEANKNNSINGTSSNKMPKVFSAWDDFAEVGLWLILFIIFGPTALIAVIFYICCKSLFFGGHRSAALIA
jgi:hypothetical protein